MKKKISLLLLSLGSLFQHALSQKATDPVLQKAIFAMGTAYLKSVQYSGTGKSGVLGQSHEAGSHWPMLIIKSDTMMVDYTNMTLYEVMVRVYNNPPDKGGGAPFLGEDRRTNIVRSFPNSPDSMEERHLQLLINPHGFLRQAVTSKTEVKNLKDGAEISFNAGKYKLVGKINDQNLVENVKTWVANDVLGDMLIETIYSDYKEYNGIKFPGKIVQISGDFPVLDLTVTDVRPNEIVHLPAAPSAPAPQPIALDPKKIADHIWFLPGGANSLLVEFSDYVAVFDAPANEARSLAIIAEVKKLVPGKPIKYIVNSHHHFDHSGGLRTYVAEGATVVTHAGNVKFYQDAWRSPRTLSPDKLAVKSRQAQFVPVSEKYSISDNTNTLELYHNQGSPHNAGMLIGYFPKDKILFVVDEYSPGRLVNGKLVPVSQGFADNLYANLQRLHLDISTVAPGHGIVVPYSEMLRDIGK